MPSSDGSDDIVGVSLPYEGLGSVDLGKEAVDGSLEVDDGTEDAAFQAAPGQPCEEAFDRIEPGAEVGMKWKTQRACRSSQARTLGCLWVA